MIQITRKQNNNGTAYLMVWIFKGKGGLLRGSLKEWDEWDKQNLHANNCTYLYFSCSKYSQIKSLLISWSLANMKLLIGCGVERWMNAIKLVRIIFNRQQQQSLPIYQRQQQPVHQKPKTSPKQGTAIWAISDRTLERSWGSWGRYHLSLLGLIILENLQKGWSGGGRRVS